MKELNIISQMVLDKQKERPILIVRWSRFLKMFLECYPEAEKGEPVNCIICEHPYHTDVCRVGGCGCEYVAKE